MRCLTLFAIILSTFSGFGQAISIAATRENIFYKGIQNPVDIVVEKMKCGSFIVTAKNGKIEKNNNCGYTFVADTIGRATISVYKVKGKDSLLLGSCEFRVKQFPDPVVKVAGQKGGQISKSLLSVQTGIKAELEDFDMDLKLSIESFTVIIIWSNDSISYKEIKGMRFTDDLKKEFSKLQPDDRVYFEDVIAVFPDERKVLMKGARFDIK